MNNFEVLEYIALRERNALFFLKAYIEKVLVDSGLYPAFEEFFELQTKESYDTVKRTFSTFIINNTNINGVVECNRIFIKVLNPLAYFKNSRGTEKGRLSEQIITYDMLMYNRNNFRDIYADKPKGVTRKEYAVTHPVEVNEAYYHYQSAKAKRFLRLFNDQNRGGQTEHLEPAHMEDRAIHMHHIFPEAIYPEICYYLENIIALTPTQHLNYAHPDGHTQEIDEQYQHLLRYGANSSFPQLCGLRACALSSHNHQSRESFAPLDSYKVLNDGYTSSLRSRHKKQVPSKDSLRRLYRFDEVFRSVFEQDAMFPNQRLLPACFQTLPAYREY